ncbi:Rhs element Vgr protein [Paucimonas lemoignei]|uniref:Rhs element Vgr protein n=1 Tax=Paucimonas lemoignei TaxID=29443 RepID=A0A4R3HP11_PAULE|nr:type VI secretion system Vgr family protein [Paucimonas lemoignei]TCS32895.1 Rhs element Vgr protein [Paucimonas lemoignei]
MSEAIPGVGSITEHLAAFSADTRLYELDTALGSDQLMVESWVGREELSSLYEWHVTCLSTDCHLELKTLLAQQVSLFTTLADGTRNRRTGWVSEVAQLGADGGLARYRLTIVPWLWLATQRRTSRVFQDATVLHIIEAVLAADAPRNNWRITPEAQSFIDSLRPRSYCCQYRESDYAFLTRILAEEGIGFTFEEDEDDGALSKQRLVLFADSVAAFAEDYSSQHANGGRGIRFHRDAAVEAQDSIQQLGCERVSQPEVTTISGWDYKAKRVIAASAHTAHPNDNKNIPFVESADWLGLYPFASQDEAEHYVRILRQAMDCRTKTWFGQGKVRSFRTGTVFDLTEAPFPRQDGESEEAKHRRFALLGGLHAGVNNLPTGLKAELAARLGPAPAYPGQRPAQEWREDGFAAPSAWPDSLPSDFGWEDGSSVASSGSHEQHAKAGPNDGTIAATYLDRAAWDTLLKQADTSGYANRFTAIRADVIWRPALLDGTGLLLNPKPTALGSQTAIVVGPDGSTANAGTVHTDDLGRVRIRFHWQTEESNTCWVRVTQLYAGPGYGAQFIPRIGQEVLVKFFGNDIDRPIVNGVLYNGQGQDDASALASAKDHASAGQDNKLGAGASPAWHGAAAGEHKHGAYLSGFKSVALGTDGYGRQANQLVFDDSTGRLRTQLATDTAATQLNLGHLIHQADNYRGSFRGTGWELRTDAYGAIRAGKGLMLSTYYGTAPGGLPEPAGDNAAGVAMLKQIQGFADTFNQAAQTHQTVQMVAAKGSKTLNGGASQSSLDDKQPPLAAMLKKVSGQVSALDGSEDGSGDKVPHSTAPLVTVAAQAGLGMTASDGLHVAAGEVVHFASGRDMHVAVGEALSVHSGQAIGLLAGAVGAGDGDVGIKLYAGQGDVDMQAQSDTMTFAAKELVRLISANSHVDFAAAKSIELCTEGGASLKIEGGNITFACPGKISIKAASKSFTGPARLNYALPQMPRGEFKLKKNYPISR